MVLPIGAVCDACNHYLGHELDSVLAAHSAVSLVLQVLHAPGKKGKPRPMVGNVGRKASPRELTIPVETPQRVVDADGSVSYRVQPLMDRSFDLLRFRRSLHHVAMNAVAYQDGVERAYSAEFDATRRYVRSPHKGEAWPYAQFIDLNKGFAPDALLAFDRQDRGEIVILALAKSVAFAVDVFNTGALQAWTEREMPPGSQVVTGETKVPRASRARRQEHYRIRIMLDE